MAIIENGFNILIFKIPSVNSASGAIYTSLPHCPAFAMVIKKASVFIILPSMVMV